MIGIRTPDNTLFITARGSSLQILEKYGITFIYDVAQYLTTLNKLEQLHADIFVPSHAMPTNNIHTLTAINRSKVYEIQTKIVEIYNTPQTIDAVIQSIFNIYSLTMTVAQYVLVGSTIRSYLS